MTKTFFKKITYYSVIILTVLSIVSGTIPTVQASGVGLVKDIRDSYDPDVKFLIDINGTLYFRALGEFGYELWKSDGTENGTLVVKSSEAFNDYENLQYFTKVNENLYFSATDSDGIELWISNGTGVGTKVVKNIDSNFGPSFLTDINGVLFFVTDNSMYGSQIWKTNGTAGGTNIVINPTYFTYNQKPLYLTNVNGMLFFSHHDDLYGRELWKTDGLNTFGEPVLVKDINESSNSSPANLISINGDLYFTADDGVNGRELWITDGSEAGTQLIKNIRSGVAGSSPNNLTNVNGNLYFTADDGVNGVELWKSDGTEIGTELVRNIRSGVAGSSPNNLTNVNGNLYFTADDGVNGVELWKSDGVTGVTEMVKNINENSSSSPANLANINGILYFSADNGTNGKELWKSDGTANGTVMIKDIAPGSNGSDPSYMVNLNNQIFFSATDGTHGRELYSLTFPTLSISSTHIILESSTSTPASISVSLDQANNVDITFSLTTSGTATLNTDYTLDNTTYTIPAGETSVNVLFTPIDNFLDESNKVAELVLSSTDAFISDTQATSTITITDDDVSSTTLTDSSMIVHKNQTTGVYKVVLNAQPTSDVIITPTVPTGFFINPGLLTFTSGNWNTPQNITVTLTDPANTNYQTSYITHSITSDDSNYSAHVPANTSVTLINVNTSGGGGSTTSGLSGGSSSSSTSSSSSNNTSTTNNQTTTNTTNNPVVPTAPTTPAIPTTPNVVQPVTPVTTPQVINSNVPIAWQNILNDGTSIFSITQQPEQTVSPTVQSIITKVLPITTISETTKAQVTTFITQGTDTTKTLGTGERAGVVSSFISAYNKLPSTQTDWQDVIKLANGRWPEQRNQTSEDKAKDNFTTIYKREPNKASSYDNNAITIMAYGLRPTNRNLNSEKNAINTFKSLNNRLPSSASDWDTIRAIAYSGAKR